MTAIIVPMDKIRAGRRLAIEASRTRDIGLRFSAARRAIGMSQAELCKVTGLPSAQVSQWETGKHRPSLDAIVALLPLLEVDLDYLFLGDFSAMPWEKRLALQNAYEEAIEEAAGREAALSERATKRG